MGNNIFSEIFLFNSDNFINLVFKLTINLVFIFILIKLIYFKLRNNRTYLFTFIITNLLVFLVCYLMNNLTLSLGFSFGLFAIFSILRFRTMSIPIKEMTYLFISIGLAVMNALYNSANGIVELLFANGLVILLTFILEKAWVKNEQMKYLVYEKIENVKPENHKKLLEDLINRTGLNIHRFEIGKIDFLKDVACIRIYYYSNDSNHFVHETDQDDDD